MYSTANVQPQDASGQDAGQFLKAIGGRQGIICGSHGNLQRSVPSDLRLAISRLADVDSEGAATCDASLPVNYPVEG